MNQATVTAKIGPAETVTAAVLTNIKGINFAMSSNILTVDGVDYDISAATVITCTKSGSTYTWIIS